MKVGESTSLKSNYASVSMGRKSDDLSFRMNFIKEILNNKSVTPLIDFDQKSINSITNEKTTDIRVLLNKQYFGLPHIIEQLGGKLKYVKSGSTGHTFKATSPNGDNGLNYAVKIVAYPKRENYGDMYDSTRPENAELMMLKKLSYFVVRNQTPHIVLPICTFNTPIKPIVALSNESFKNNKKFEEFIQRYKKKQYYENMSVLISEWANGGDLMDYIKKNYKSFTAMTWRVLFFQLLSVLAIIQAKYPSFRHNDLKPNNVLIHNIEPSKSDKYKYVINKTEYMIPYIGFIIKIWDFDFACIPGLVDNAKVNAQWTSKINIHPKRNQYYDVHYFFNTLTGKGFFPEFFSIDEVPLKVKQFVRRVVPEKYSTGDEVTEKGRIMTNEEITTPDKILKTDPFFAKLRIR